MTLRELVEEAERVMRETPSAADARVLMSFCDEMGETWSGVEKIEYESPDVVLHMWSMRNADDARA